MDVNSSIPKFCVDCRWYRQRRKWWSFGLRVSVCGKTDLIDGSGRNDTTLCVDERRYSSRCGLHANFHEPAPKIDFSKFNERYAKNQSQKTPGESIS